MFRNIYERSFKKNGAHMIGPKIGELFKKILQKTLRYYSVLRRPSHSDGDWDADARATSQFRPGHGAGASGILLNPK